MWIASALCLLPWNSWKHSKRHCASNCTQATEVGMLPFQ
jgi:hypothetical protein